MKSKSPLTQEQRAIIAHFWQQHKSYSFISKEIGVHRTTVAREIKRHAQSNGYHADPAHEQMLLKRRQNRRLRVDQRAFEIIENKMNHYFWSPEQVSHYLKKHHLIHICTSTIYNLIYRQSIRVLFKSMRRGRLRRRKRASARAEKQGYPFEKNIRHRPKTVDLRLGNHDWEGDVVLGKKTKSKVLVTLANRKSRQILMGVSASKTTEDVCRTIISIAKQNQVTIETLTLDNGKEFAQYTEVERLLKCDCYFADPFSSWQRGTNENSNGLIRQFFPKGSDFNQLNQNEVQRVQTLLNTRPRKILDFLTPDEAQTLFETVHP